MTLQMYSRNNPIVENFGTAPVPATLALRGGTRKVSLEIAERDREGITVLDCNGRFVLGPATEEFRNRTRALLDAGTRNIILNFLNVSYIDSSGLGELVALANMASRDKGMVKLVELDKKSVELLLITKLTTLFELYDDEQQAINSFFPDRNVRTFDLLSFVREIGQEQA